MKTGDREKGEVVGVFIKVYWRDVGLNFFQCCVFISLKYIYMLVAYYCLPQ